MDHQTASKLEKAQSARLEYERAQAELATAHEALVEELHGSSSDPSTMSWIRSVVRFGSDRSGTPWFWPDVVVASLRMLLKAVAIMPPNPGEGVVAYQIRIDQWFCDKWREDEQKRESRRT